MGVSIAQAGVSVAPVAAPSNFAPSDFFAAVKGKLKPVFKRKSAGAAKEKSSGAQPEVCPDGSFAGEQEDVTAHDPHARGDSVSLHEEQGDEERETVADVSLICTDRQIYRQTDGGIYQFNLYRQTNI